MLGAVARISSPSEGRTSSCGRAPGIGKTTRRKLASAPREERRTPLPFRPTLTARSRDQLDVIGQATGAGLQAGGGGRPDRDRKAASRETLTGLDS